MDLNFEVTVIFLSLRAGTALFTNTFHLDAAQSGLDASRLLDIARPFGPPLATNFSLRSLRDMIGFPRLDRAM